MKFKKPDIRMPNKIVYFEDSTDYYFVSYNPVANHWKPEIAIKGMKWYYILNWDLRKEIEKCKNFEEALGVFKNSDLEISGRSNDINNI